MSKTSKIAVTFDFDGTLSEPSIQDWFRQLQASGKCQLYILTRRYDELHKHRYEPNPKNDDLYEVCRELGIPRHEIIFTNFRGKHEYLAKSRVVAHIDNDSEEIRWINDRCETRAFDVRQEDCLDRLNRYLAFFE